MKSRTNALQDIRPELNLVHDKSLDFERFQNQTLRPILKFQHTLLVVHFQSLIKENKTSYRDKTIEEKRMVIRGLLKNPGPRLFSLALVVGLFTVDEYHIYQSNKKEYSKRMISMLIERVVDGLENKEVWDAIKL